VTSVVRTTTGYALLAATSLATSVAAADVRVYRELDEFLEQTEATVVSAPYPDFGADQQVDTLLSGDVQFYRSAGGLFPTEWTPALPGNDLAISGQESFDIRLLRPHHHAAGFLVFEPSCTDCVDSTFLVRVIGQDSGATPGTPTLLHEDTFQPPDDTVAFLGFASDLRIVRLEVRETVGTDDNEYFGPIYGRRDRPGSIPPGQVPRVLEMNQPLDFPVAWERRFDFDATPAGSGYLGVALEGIELMATGTSAWTVQGTSPLGGRAGRQPAAQETWTLVLPSGSHAVEFRLWESSLPGSAADSCFNDPCFDTRYLVEAFNGSQRIWSSDYSPWNDRANQLALWSNVAIDRVEIRGVFNNSDDELLGDIRTSRAPLPAGFPRRIASQDAADFGDFAAVAGGRAILSRSDGFELWTVDDDDQWSAAAMLEIDLALEALDFDGNHLVVAGELPGGGRRLRIFGAAGNDPAAWPVADFDFAPRARAIAVDGDLVAVGRDDDRVAIYRRAAGTWIEAVALQADPPVAGVTAFGRDLGLDWPLLVVGADNDVFHVYRDEPQGLVEVFRQDQPTSPGTQYVGVSGNLVVQQTFAGSVLIYAPDSQDTWDTVAALSGSLPFAGGFGLGNGVRFSGDFIVTLQSFSTAEVSDFRQAVSVWGRRPDGSFTRRFVMADPHLSGDLGALLGNFGKALSLDGRWMLLGHAATPWCRGVERDFFGDNGEPGYRSVCEGRSGAAFVARLDELDLLFRDRFAAP
jgi:hypothetical protein